MIQQQPAQHLCALPPQPCPLKMRGPESTPARFPLFWQAETLHSTAPHTQQRHIGEPGKLAKRRSSLALLIYSNLMAEAEDAEVQAPNTLPQPLAVLRCRPEGAYGGPETVFYVLGTAHVSSESCEDVTALIRAVKPQARRRSPSPPPPPLPRRRLCPPLSPPQLHCQTRHCWRSQSPACNAASCTARHRHIASRPHRACCCLPAAGCGCGAVCRAQAHPDCGQAAGADADGGADRDPRGARLALPRHLLVVRAACLGPPCRFRLQPPTRPACPPPAVPQPCGSPGPRCSRSKP